ncbi:MAG: phosphatidate cytidylyltransferase [Candidatus Limiplasma sp.]|nr:phosphatidate cytidylyltransferase [Candidatus Limiplasma sp.]
MAQRIITGAILVLALAVLLYLGGWVFAIAAFLVFALAIYEELHALTQAGHKPVWWTAFAALIISVPMVLMYSYAAIIPILTVLSFCALLKIMRRPEPDLIDVLVSVLPMLTLVLPAICIFGILETTPRALQLFFLVSLFVIAVGGDTFAYFVGSRIGGQKLCPNISPKKTISGAIGGLLGSVLCALVTGWIFTLCAPNLALPPFWANMLVGLFGGLAGQVGDLFASMVKRHCQVKDFGNLFPGHGGMLDRLDSISFVAIIVYCYRIILLWGTPAS